MVVPIQSRASSLWALRFLIYTQNIRNRRNSHRISNLDFSNLYKTGAFFLMFCSSIECTEISDRWPPAMCRSRRLIFRLKIRNRRKPRRISNLHFSNRGSDKASASRANDVRRGTSPTLIFRLKIRNRRKPRRISNLHFSNLYGPPALSRRIPQPRNDVCSRPSSFISALRGRSCGS